MACLFSGCCAYFTNDAPPSDREVWKKHGGLIVDDPFHRTCKFVFVSDFFSASHVPPYAVRTQWIHDSLASCLFEPLCRYEPWSLENTETLEHVIAAVDDDVREQMKQVVEFKPNEDGFKVVAQ